MTVLPITCDNCGAKYKLPPTFKGSQAKCQKCGSVIDVATQRESAAEAPAAAARPAGTRPAAAARPAVDRSKNRPAAAKRGAKADAGEAQKPTRKGRSRSTGADDGDEATPRQGRAGQRQKSSQTPLILSGIGLIAIVVVVVIIMMNNGKQGDEQADNTPASNQTDGTGNAGNDNTGQATAAGGNTEPAGGDAAKPAAGEDPKADPKADAGSGEPAMPPAGATADASGAKPAQPDQPTPAGAEAGDATPAPADTGDPTREKQPWEKLRNAPQTMDQVTAAKERYGEVEWSAEIDDAKKAEIRGIVADIEIDGGLPTIRAKRKLVEAGYPALFGIIERLRELDYKNNGEASLGFELNKLIEEITGGLNARYAAIGASEVIPPAKAEWNTQTVNAWMRILAKWPDEAAFKENKRSRAEKQ